MKPKGGKSAWGGHKQSHHHHDVSVQAISKAGCFGPEGGILWLGGGGGG